MHSGLRTVISGGGSVDKIPSLQDILALDSDQQHYLLCEWARDFKIHEKQQNGSIQRIEDRLNKLTMLTIVNSIILVLSNPHMWRDIIGVVRSIF